MWELATSKNNVSIAELCRLGEVTDDVKESFTLTYFTPTINNYTGELIEITSEKITLVSLTPLLVN